MAYKRFIGANNASWNTSTSWSPTGVPGTADEAVFEAARTVTGTGSTILHLVNVNNTTLNLNLTSGFQLSINGNVTNNGTITSTNGGSFNLASGDDSYVYCQVEFSNIDININKSGRFVQFDSNIVMKDLAGGNWTSSRGVMTVNACSEWRMQGNSITLNRLVFATSSGKGLRWNGTVIARTASTTSTFFNIPTGAGLSFIENSGKARCFPATGTGATVVAASFCDSYNNSIDWQYDNAENGNARTFTANNSHVRNAVFNCQMGSGTYNIHDSLSGTFGGQTSVASLTTVSCYANNGITFNYSCPVPFTTVNFIRNLGSNNNFNITDCRAVTSNLNSDAVTYYLTVSAGTAAKTFNLNATSTSEYYVKIINSSTIATINANGTNCNYYFGWSNNAFSQNTGAFSLNCGITGSGSNFYYDNCTDNASAPCTITMEIGNHYVGTGLNIAGTINFNRGTINLTGQPIVGTFNSNPSPTSNARAFNWNGYYIRINNAARTANAHGTGGVNIVNATTTTSTSSMDSSDNCDGGIQVESTGTVNMGLWTDSSCPRLIFKAFGTTASARTFASGNIRSLEIQGPCTVSGTTPIYKSGTTRVTWNGVGSAANFNSLRVFLGPDSNGTNFTYNNANALTDDTKRIQTVIANDSYGPSSGTFNCSIIAYTLGIDLTKGFGNYYLDDINVKGYVLCNPTITSTGTTEYRWRKVIKSTTTSGFAGYTSSDDFRAYTQNDPTKTTHIVESIGIDVKNNKFVIGGNNNVVSGYSSVNVDAPILGDLIEINSGGSLNINSNYTFKNISLPVSNGRLNAASNFTITGKLSTGSSTPGRLDIENCTIIFTGQDSTTLYDTLSGVPGTYTGSNLIFRNTGGGDRTAIIGNTTSYNTITNGCTFTHTGSGDGTGWLYIIGSTSTGTITTLQSENTSVSRGIRITTSASQIAPTIINTNFSGISSNKSYVWGNMIKSGGNANLNYLGIRNSNVTPSNTWFADNSIDYGGNSGWNITVEASYSVTPAAGSVNEGANITINISTAGVNNGTTLYWTIFHNTTQDQDFNTTSGSFIINSNAGSFTITTVADFSTEGAQTFAIQIRTGSTSGTVVATSTNITINDTSAYPVYIGFLKFF